MIRPALFLALLSAPAAAQQVTPQVPEAFLDALGRAGLTGVIEKDAHGFPSIRTEASDSVFHVYFYDCDDRKRDCRSIQFASGWTIENPPSLEQVNAWNRQNRWADAWLDDEGMPRLEMDVNMDGGGIPQDNLNDTVTIWIDMLSNYEDMIGW
ncbi:MAG: YbjN domain-containing protein [Hasllibacter sp.]